MAKLATVREEAWYVGTSHGKATALRSNGLAGCRSEAQRVRTQAKSRPPTILALLAGDGAVSFKTRLNDLGAGGWELMHANSLVHPKQVRWRGAPGRLLDEPVFEGTRTEFTAVLRRQSAR